MSKSGKNYTKEKVAQRNLLEKKKNHPIRLFIKSWNFWGKSFLSLFIFIPIIYALSDSGNKHILIIIYSLICIPLLPFAKKCSDDIFLHYFSKRTFDEFINNGGVGGAGIFYSMVLIPLVIPLAIGYFIYQIKKWRDNGN